MKTIVITGPSGSGKTYLSNKLSKLFDKTIVIETDSYYKDNFYIKLLSLFMIEIYDRLISIKKLEIVKTIKAINNNEKYIRFFDYNFFSKRSSHSIKDLGNGEYCNYLIIEGIFAHRLDLDYKKTINIICEENKEICYLRRLNRDKLERGRNINEVNNKFRKSWKIYYKELKISKLKPNLISLNTNDKISYNKLILILTELLNNKTKENI
tara:strand:+ start:3273 stop:3902 length:630 start_codon:yes stop_codon:yes gene_type:complete